MTGRRDLTGSFCVSLISSRPIQPSPPPPPLPLPPPAMGRGGGEAREHPPPARGLRHQVAAAGRPRHRATHTDGHTDCGRRQARRAKGQGQGSGRRGARSRGRWAPPEGRERPGRSQKGDQTRGAAAGAGSSLAAFAGQTPREAGESLLDARQQRQRPVGLPGRARHQALQGPLRGRGVGRRGSGRARRALPAALAQRQQRAHLLLVAERALAVALLQLPAKLGREEGRGRCPAPGPLSILRASAPLPFLSILLASLGVSIPLPEPPPSP